MVKNLPTNAGDTGDLGLIPAFGKIPWMRKLLPTPVFLPGRFHEQKSLVATIPGVTKSQTWLSMHTCI